MSSGCLSFFSLQEEAGIRGFCLSRGLGVVYKRQVSDRVRVFDTQIPFSVRAAESAQEGQSIFAYDKGGKVAAAYEAVTKEVLEHESKERHRSRSDGVR